MYQNVLSPWAQIDQSHLYGLSPRLDTFERQDSGDVWGLYEHRHLHAPGCGNRNTKTVPRGQVLPFPLYD